jgi:Ran GTPase-activating protein (RanGAP) involved in mRNA processing and transport
VICSDPGYDPDYILERDLYSCALRWIRYGYHSDSIMSDADSDADSISDSSNAQVHAGGNEALISSAVRELCDQLRANDPRVLADDSVFELNNYIMDCSETECIAIFQALKENTSVKHIDFRRLFGGQYSKRSVLVAAEYVESSKTLQTLNLNIGLHQYSCEVREMISLVLRALSPNTSVANLIIHPGVIRFASEALQELLACTQTLQKLQIVAFGYEAFDDWQTAAIASGFADNKTLRDLELKSWPEANLVPVLTALQHHPALQKIHLSELSFDNLPSLFGLEVLLRNRDSKVKELVLEQVGPRTVGLRLVMQELGRNTTVTNLTIRDSVLSRENVQQLKAVLRQNTALQYLDLDSIDLGSAGLAEIAPALYRNTSIKTLDLTCNGLDDIESANGLRELLRRNKTITSLCIAQNVFGLNTAAARSILEGVRSNTALQQLDLDDCKLGDRGISLLAKALAIRNASILELNLQGNKITSVGVRALVDDNVEAVKTLTKLSLLYNPIRSEGVTILAGALGRNAMPSLKRLYLCVCHIDDDGFVVLVSALEQKTSLQILNVAGNQFGERGFMALAKSLPKIKGLQQIDFTANASFQSTLPLLLKGFRKNTSLVKVTIDIAGFAHRGDWSQELKFLGQRNRFTPLLKASHPPDTSPQLGIWSRALAKVVTEPDVLFHVLRNKPKLVGSAGGSKKRKRDDE